MRQKLVIFCVLYFATNCVEAQLSGSVESNAAYYIDDEKVKLESIDALNRLRSNNYIRLDYRHKNFTTGIQIESYEKKALLNFSPQLNGTNVGTFYVNYKNDKLKFDATIGHFYTQFGSGLVLRTWEDRQLGIANSLNGILVNYKPLNTIKITTLFGRQRNGFAFDLTNSNVAGVNTEIELSTILKAKKIKYGLGLSYVNRNEANPFVANLTKNTFLSSFRSNLSIGGFSAEFEYAFKSKDALVEFGNIRPEFLFDGDVYLANLSYTKKNFGITTNLRRTENFAMYSERKYAGNSYSQAILNFVPALTKQYDYSLANIYVYAAQPSITFEPNRNKSGEIGGQVDVFFNAQKHTFWGGKYGTSFSANFSYWGGLQGRYDALQRKYASPGFGLGEKYYSDFSIEVKKKWTKNWQSVITYLNQYYNTRYVEEAVGEVYANTIIVDNTHQLKKGKSIRWELQHQWSKGRFNNWVAGLVEYNFGSSFGVFASDLFNYGNSNKNNPLHFYNVGATYNKNAFRLQFSYGRQRGGLICVGGVCRFVPQSAGLNL
ncbi:MAG: DUF6029 family protein, partial [Chitinophagaceae bacterium]